MRSYPVKYLWSLLLLLSPALYAQHTSITGKVADWRSVKKVGFSYWLQPGISPVITQDIDLARDSFYISLPAGVANEMFFYVDAGAGNSFHGIISRGDSIHLDFRADTMLFSGRGAAKCRAVYLTRLAGRVNRTGEVMEQLEHARAALQRAEAVLANYRDSMPGTVYSLLRADLLGGMAASMVSSYWELDPDLQNSIYASLIAPALPQLPADEISAMSARYLSYQLEKSQVDYHRATHMQCTNKAVYEWIKARYTGILQEKLLAHQLLVAFATGGQQEELEDCAKDYLGFVKTESCKTAVGMPFNRLKRGIRRGVPAPPFTLPDHNGNNVSLSQFAGKVVLLHFCSDDDNLMPTLDEISKCFKKDEVAFLHIGLKSFDIKGIGQQLYPGSHFAEMQQQYNVTTCPTLIVIARNGNIFAVKPPNPANDYGTELTNIIYEALQQ